MRSLAVCQSSLSFTVSTPETPNFAQQDPLPLFLVDTSSKPVQTATVPATTSATLPDPWDLPTLPTTPASAPTPDTPIFSGQFLLAPAKESTKPSELIIGATPATKPSKTPQPAIDYNSVLTVEQLQRKARAAGIKNFGRMKNQLLAALDS